MRWHTSQLPYSLIKLYNKILETSPVLPPPVEDAVAKEVAAVVVEIETEEAADEEVVTST
jgi:hypothetical protein